MKMKNNLLKISQKILLSAIFLAPTLLIGQSVQVLQGNYTGNTTWNESTGTLTFSKSGTMNFQNRELLYNNVWTIPENVKHVVIGKNVTVTGEFYANYNCLIEGMDWETSIVFGTSQQNYLNQSRGFSAISSADSKEREVILKLKRLTSLNPKVYHITGSYLGVIHMDSVRVIDNRGGRYNNSDGFGGAKGSTVKNCYFETGEDVIKIYADILVENTTIKMIEFAVPIQCGWGDYGSGITATFKNLKIIGNEGREPEYAIIEARQGDYTKNIIIDGFTVENPNASMFRLQQEGSTINANITNANISLKKYGAIVEAKGTRTICGSTEKLTEYNCNTLTSPSNIKDLVATSTNCTSVNLTWSDVSNEEKYSVRRKTATTSFVTIATLAANTKSYVDATAAENTTYQYAVIPVKVGATAATSNTPTITTGACTTVNNIIKAYPNPTTGILYLPEVFVNDKFSVISLATGNTVLTKTITQNGTSTLDITNKPDGSYTIKLVRNNVTSTRQITKQ